VFTRKLLNLNTCIVFQNSVLLLVKSFVRKKSLTAAETTEQPLNPILRESASNKNYNNVGVIPNFDEDAWSVTISNSV
jgi:hypothetical protein